MDGAGFEPATSTNGHLRFPTFPSDKILASFKEWLEIDELRKPRTVQHHLFWIRRLLAKCEKTPELLTREDYRSFLKKYKDFIGVHHYSNLVKAVRVFTRFLGCEEIGKSFKFPSVVRPMIIPPSREDLKRFYNALANLSDKAFFLVLASSGLRNHEAAGLRMKDIDLEIGMIVPNRGESRVSSTKGTFVTFVNQETLDVLKRYLASVDELESEDRIFGKGFGRSGITYRWKRTSKRSEVKLTPQKLRNWFCCEMGRLGVPDRYIDAFCGRVPKTILARHYTDYSQERLKLIYDKAGLKVLI